MWNVGQDEWQKMWASPLEPPFSLRSSPLKSFIVVVQSLSHVQLFSSSWTTAPLSTTIRRSFLQFMSIESVMLSKYLILCCPLLPSVFPSIRVFSNKSALHVRWPKYWSFSSKPHLMQLGVASVFRKLFLFFFNLVSHFSLVNMLMCHQVLQHNQTKDIYDIDLTATLVFYFL